MFSRAAAPAAPPPPCPVGVAAPTAPAAVAPPGGQRMLSDFGFADLYLSTGEDPNPTIIKGLKPNGVIISDGASSSMEALPDYLLEDTARLATEIREKFEQTGGQREFTVVKDGCRYRCSLIEAPESSIPRPRAASGRQDWCIRHIAGHVPELKDLGFLPDMRMTLEGLSQKRGLVLVSGSFSSGKSTTGAALFDSWVRKERAVGITLEDPPEFPLARVTTDQGAIYQIDLTERPIEAAIKAARRWAPRYVFLGEVRTSQAAAELLHIGISGPLALCTIHAADLIQAIMALVRFAAGAISEQTAREMVAASLTCVLDQEIIKGRALVSMGMVAGADNFVIRKKIELGQFQSIYEDLDGQRINREKPTGRFGAFAAT